MSEQQYDEQQLKFMTEEFCIVVDDFDQILGQDSKKNTHLMENINKGLLHRAFSCFLFKDKKLLLQQRAAEKITFPLMWTNTCCSHPLFNIEQEKDGIQGVKLAVQRKLFHELGIPASEVPIEKLKFLTRIHYKAAADEKWGEHEVDYIVFIEVDDVTVNPNANEVQDIKFVTLEEVKQIVQDSNSGKLQITPWFRLIFRDFLIPWWEKLNKGIAIEKDDRIYRLE
mmetsp:Transcript_21618/g.30224  ORF Transcript_21618/g.30224 Transcript_21618/m.30224 type:complete len:226 (+) Transcript_21618:61-738(+)